MDDKSTKETPVVSQGSDPATQPAGTPASSEPDVQGKMFQAWYEAHVKPEMQKRDTEIHGLKISQGRLEAQLKKAREWDEETLQSFIKAEGTYEGRKTNWAKQGVPEWILESTVPAKLDEVAEKFLALKPSSAQTRPADEQFKAFQEWQKAQSTQQPVNPSQPARPNSGLPAGGVQVDKDNIDALHLQGLVTDQKYRTFLKTGQI